LCSHCLPAFFQEAHISGDTDFDFVAVWNPDAILAGPAVSDHETFEVARIQLSRLFLSRMDEGLGTDCNEMGNIGFLAV
jgi:hypothetical protein